MAPVVAVSLRGGASVMRGPCNSAWRLGRWGRREGEAAGETTRVSVRAAYEEVSGRRGAGVSAAQVKRRQAVGIL